MEEEKIQKFAKENGYVKAVYKGIWKDYKVYEPIYNDGEKVCWVGEPTAILVKDKEIRFSNGLEELNDIIENIKK